MHMLIGLCSLQSTVETSEFQAAKPDILARAGPEIIERLNAGGKVLEDALKLVCLHWKGLEVEVVEHQKILCSFLVEKCVEFS